MQSKKESLIEVISNLIIGYFFSVGVTLYIVGPLYGFNVSAKQSFEITTIMTVLSFTRMYVLRRFFNTKEKGFLYKSVAYSVDKISFLVNILPRKDIKIATIIKNNDPSGQVITRSNRKSTKRLKKVLDK